MQWETRGNLRLTFCNGTQGGVATKEVWVPKSHLKHHRCEVFRGCGMWFLQSVAPVSGPSSSIDSGSISKSTAGTRGYAEVRGGTRRYPLASGTFIQKHLCRVRGGTRGYAMVRDGLLLRWYAMIYIATRIR